jgi:hypothetical protein
LLSALCWPLQPYHDGAFAFVGLVSSPLLVSAQSQRRLQHAVVCGIIVVLFFVVRGLVPIPGIVIVICVGRRRYANRLDTLDSLVGLGNARQLGLQHSGGYRAGIFASVVLASLPASCWCHCRHCAGVAALIAPASLPLLHWRCCPHCTRITASITLALLPVPPPRHRQHCAGIFALVALVQLLLLHCLCCAAVIALVAPVSAPAGRRL